MRRAILTIIVAAQFCAVAAARSGETGQTLPSKAATASGPTRTYSLYTPEFRLLAETALTDAPAAPIAYEYLTFNGEPLAQIDATTGVIAYDFNDHLGAPFLQTNSTGAVTWQVEPEAYAAEYRIPTGADRHQPLGAPGQEYTQVAPELRYNIFRWYRAGWGRYTQADPINFGSLYAGALADLDLADALQRAQVLLESPQQQDPYAYGAGNPTRNSDPDGRFLISPTCARYWAGPALRGSRALAQQYGFPKGSEDPLRHCLWSCLMTKYCYDSGTALAAGWANEIYARRRLFPGPENERRQDLANNRQGRDCGERTCDCVACCIGKYRSGELQRQP